MGKKASTTARDAQIKPSAIAGFHRALAKWYKTHGRHDLPWRNTADPYPIWLSEVMLQQTRVATVRDRFYGPFLDTFPTIEALAAAPREIVMKAWEGLGYYRRAGNLHEAAKIVAAASLRGQTATSPQAKAVKGRSNPSASPKPPRWIASLSARNDADRSVFPNDVNDLLNLPGIGKNTAHAIAAFAYHQPVAILEANVKRVVARVFALEHPSDAELWAGAEALLNRDAPFDYNQAMMDLGSMICTPKSPNCNACPASSICKGKAAPKTYPAPKTKKQVPTREVIIYVREDAAGRLFLEKREEKLLGGLYGFPQAPLAPSSRATTRDLKQHNEALGCGPRSRVKPGMTTVGTVTHIYSHFKLIGHVMREKINASTNSPNWHSREEIARLPLSKLDHKVLALVENCHSAQKKRTKAKPSRERR